jgi:hypothetical protein
MVKIRLLLLADYTSLSGELQNLTTVELQAHSEIQTRVLWNPTTPINPQITEQIIYTYYDYALTPAAFKDQVLIPILNYVKEHEVISIAFAFHTLPTGTFWIPYVNLEISDRQFNKAIDQYSNVIANKPETDNLRTARHDLYVDFADLYSEARSFATKMRIGFDVNWQTGIPMFFFGSERVSIDADIDVIIVQYLQNMYSGVQQDVALKIFHRQDFDPKLVSPEFLPQIYQKIAQIREFFALNGRARAITSQLPQIINQRRKIRDRIKQLTNPDIEIVVPQNHSVVRPPPQPTRRYSDLVIAYSKIRTEPVYVGAVIEREQKYVELDTNPTYADFLDVGFTISQILKPSADRPIAIDLLGCGISRDGDTFYKMSKQFLDVYHLIPYGSISLTTVTGREQPEDATPLHRFVDLIPMPKLLDYRGIQLASVIPIEQYRPGEQNLDHLGLLRYQPPSTTADLYRLTDDVLQAQLPSEDIIRKYTLKTIDLGNEDNLSQAIEFSTVEAYFLQLETELRQKLATYYLDVDLDSLRYKSKLEVQMLLHDAKKLGDPADIQQDLDFQNLLDFFDLRWVIFKLFRRTSPGYLQQMLNRTFDPPDAIDTVKVDKTMTISQTLAVIEAQPHPKLTGQSAELFLRFTSAQYYAEKILFDSIFQVSNADLTDLNLQRLAVALQMPNYDRAGSTELMRFLSYKAQLYESLLYYHPEITLEAYFEVPMVYAARDVIRVLALELRIPESSIHFMKNRQISNNLLETGFVLRPATYDEITDPQPFQRHLMIQDCHFVYEFSSYACYRDLTAIYFDGVHSSTRFGSVLAVIGEAFVYLYDVIVSLTIATASRIYSAFYDFGLKAWKLVKNIGDDLYNLASNLAQFNLSGVVKAYASLVRDSLQLTFMVCVEVFIDFSQIRLATLAARGILSDGFGLDFFDPLFDLVEGGIELSTKIQEFPFIFYGDLVSTLITGDSKYIEDGYDEGKVLALDFSKYMTDNSFFFGVASFLDPTGLIGLLNALALLIKEVDEYNKIKNNPKVSTVTKNLAIARITFRVTAVIAAVIKCATFLIPGVNVLGQILADVSAVVAGLSNVGVGVTEVIENPEGPSGYVDIGSGVFIAGIGVKGLAGASKEIKLARAGIPVNRYDIIAKALPPTSSKNPLLVAKSMGLIDKAKSSYISSVANQEAFDVPETLTRIATQVSTEKIAPSDLLTVSTLGASVDFIKGASLTTNPNVYIGMTVASISAAAMGNMIVGGMINKGIQPDHNVVDSDGNLIPQEAKPSTGTALPIDPPKPTTGVMVNGEIRQYPYLNSPKPQGIYLDVVKKKGIPNDNYYLKITDPQNDKVSFNLNDDEQIDPGTQYAIDPYGRFVLPGDTTYTQNDWKTAPIPYGLKVHHDEHDESYLGKTFKVYSTAIFNPEEGLFQYYGKEPDGTIGLLPGEKFWFFGNGTKYGFFVTSRMGFLNNDNSIYYVVPEDGIRYMVTVDDGITNITITDGKGNILVRPGENVAPEWATGVKYYYLSYPRTESSAAEVMVANDVNPYLGPIEKVNDLTKSIPYTLLDISSNTAFGLQNFYSKYYFINSQGVFSADDETHKRFSSMTIKVGQHYFVHANGTEAALLEIGSYSHAPLATETLVAIIEIKDKKKFIKIIKLSDRSVVWEAGEDIVMKDGRGGPTYFTVIDNGGDNYKFYAVVAPQNPDAFFPRGQYILLSDDRLFFKVDGRTVRLLTGDRKLYLGPNENFIYPQWKYEIIANGTDEARINLYPPWAEHYSQIPATITLELIKYARSTDAKKNIYFDVSDMNGNYIINPERVKPDNFYPGGSYYTFRDDGPIAFNKHSVEAQDQLLFGDRYRVSGSLADYRFEYVIPDENYDPVHPNPLSPPQLPTTVINNNKNYVTDRWPFYGLITQDAQHNIECWVPSRPLIDTLVELNHSTDEVNYPDIKLGSFLLNYRRITTAFNYPATAEDAGDTEEDRHRKVVGIPDNFIDMFSNPDIATVFESGVDQSNQGIYFNDEFINFGFGFENSTNLVFGGMLTFNNGVQFETPKAMIEWITSGTLQAHVSYTSNLPPLPFDINLYKEGPDESPEQSYIVRFGLGGRQIRGFFEIKQPSAKGFTPALSISVGSIATADQTWFNIPGDTPTPHTIILRDNVIPLSNFRVLINPWITANILRKIVLQISSEDPDKIYVNYEEKGEFYIDRSNPSQSGPPSFDTGVNNLFSAPNLVEMIQFNETTYGIEVDGVDYVLTFNQPYLFSRSAGPNYDFRNCGTLQISVDYLRRIRIYNIVIWGTAQGSDLIVEPDHSGSTSATLKVDNPDVSYFSGGGETQLRSSTTLHFYEANVATVSNLEISQMGGDPLMYAISLYENTNSGVSAFLSDGSITNLGNFSSLVLGAAFLCPVGSNVLSAYFTIQGFYLFNIIPPFKTFRINPIAFSDLVVPFDGKIVLIKQDLSIPRYTIVALAEENPAQNELSYTQLPGVPGFINKARWSSSYFCLSTNNYFGFGQAATDSTNFDLKFITFTDGTEYPDITYQTVDISTNSLKWGTEIKCIRGIGNMFYVLCKIDTNHDCIYEVSWDGLLSSNKYRIRRVLGHPTNNPSPPPPPDWRIPINLILGWSGPTEYAITANTFVVTDGFLYISHTLPVHEVPFISKVII